MKRKAPSTQLIQAFELTELKKEKETLTRELTDFKEKLLKFAVKRKEWERDMSLLVESEKDLRENIKNRKRSYKKKKKSLKVE